jgi:phage protein D
MLARRAFVNITYQGVDITASIKNDLINFEYTDNASGESDSISIILKDDTGKWISAWAPEQGAKIIAAILTTNWLKDGDKQYLACGAFMVDELEYTGRPRTLAINAAALPSRNSFRDTLKSRTWKGVTVRKIANDIAYDAGLSLFYDTAKTYTISSIEQSEKSDSAFLADVCAKYGLCFKVYNDKIVIFSEAEYEAKEPIGTITEDKVEGWTANKTLTETGYDACVVTYTPPKSGKKLQYTLKLTETTTKVLRINRDVSSVAEAETVAKAELRKANKKQYTMTFTLPGNVYLIASYPIMVSGFGVFDGKYYIDKVEHSIGNGYTTSLEVHKVLEGGY